MGKMTIESLKEALCSLGLGIELVRLKNHSSVCIRYSLSRVERALDDAWERNR